jgi:hypothetical protein
MKPISILAHRLEGAALCLHAFCLPGKRRALCTNLECQRRGMSIGVGQVAAVCKLVRRMDTAFSEVQARAP